MLNLTNFLGTEYLGNTGLDYTIAFGTFVLLFMLIVTTKKIFLSQFSKFAKKTPTKIDDILVDTIKKFGISFYFFLSLYVGIRTLVFPDNIQIPLNYLFLVIGIYYGFRIINVFINFGAEAVIEKSQKKEKKVSRSAILLIALFSKIVIWIVILIFIISNLGYNVTSLVAGLGIGGIAIALALQNILSDIFCSFSIYFDKPFEEGDFIIVGDDLGIVKRIGIKSTRIQALQGEEVVISNRDLTNARVHNYKKMKRRRIIFNFGVTYGTTTKKLEKIPKIVKTIIEKIDKVDLDRVHFKGFGDFSLNFEVVYYVNLGEYAAFMDVQQEINLKLMKEFEKEKIEFAYPTQTLYVNKQSSS